MLRKRSQRRRHQSPNDLRNATISGVVSGTIRALLDWLRDFIY
ncbi:MULTISPECIES: hypothetical protein [Streptomyces]|uniref:Uncharacterized protein n=1 Tax=Streptomyces hydrogenans TaxID=1873719 RepID=A0ABQ3PNP2_9ACTN|nr:MULTISPECIES: hypothetical protein [Streptomyces]GHG41199.1 hypothetical protein GCM10018784_63690 [Streptomyces hydrogenans]GHI26612.1 hypothetical protein Shyd_79830 [Streptomyces hydrogenans]